MCSRRLLCLATLAMTSVLVVCIPLRSQVNTVALSGTLLDPQGKNIAGADVSIKNLATGAARRAMMPDNTC